MKGSRHLEDQAARRKFLIDFHDFGLTNHKMLLKAAFVQRNWPLLRENSIRFESDCNYIGAVELCGALIQLRMLLDSKEISLFSLSNSMKSMEITIGKLQIFLKDYLSSRNILTQQVESPLESSESPLLFQLCSALTWSCTLQ